MIRTIPKSTTLKECFQCNSLLVLLLLKTQRQFALLRKPIHNCWLLADKRFWCYQIRGPSSHSGAAESFLQNSVQLEWFISSRICSCRRRGWRPLLNLGHPHGWRLSQEEGNVCLPQSSASGRRRFCPQRKTRLFVLGNWESAAYIMKSWALGGEGADSGSKLNLWLWLKIEQRGDNRG